jgi:hypothetical protein
MDIEPHAPRGSPLTISISELPAEHGEECVFCTAANAAEAAGNPARLVDPPVSRMLINLRGTSGSGKSTAVLGLLVQCPHKRIYGALGRLPEAYALCAQPVFVIGPYVSNCGGCDRILPFALVPQLIEKYAQRGDVVFEGLLLSTFYGEVGRMMERRDAAVMFLDTPLEVCIARVKARRGGRPFNPKLLTQKHATIARLKDKFGARALLVSDRDATATIMRLLRTAEGTSAGATNSRGWAARLFPLP